MAVAVGFGFADVLVEKLAAHCGALELVVVPDAVLVVRAAKFVVGVLVLAVAAAVVDGPLALGRVGGTSSGRAEAVAVLEALLAVPEAGGVGAARAFGGVAERALAGANVGGVGRVPFAAVVGVAHVNGPLVGAADAADVALRRVEDAHGVGVALAGVRLFAATAAAASGVEVPHAASELAAAVGVVGKELAVHLADVGGRAPVAHGGFGGAGGLNVDLGTGGRAAALGVVPHALLIVLARGGVFGEGVASEAFVVALAVGGVPVARGVGAAAGLIALVGVLRALITAATKSGFPGALRILGAVGFAAVAVLALSLAVL